MTLVTLSIIGLLLYHTERFLINGQERILIANARHMALNLQQTMPLLDREKRQDILEKLLSDETGIVYITILDPEGQTINHSDSARRGMSFKDESAIKALKEGVPIETYYSRDLDNPNSPFYKQEVIDMIFPYKESSGKVLGAVNVGLSLERIDHIRHDYYERMAIISLLVIILILVLTALFYRDIIMPVNNLLVAFHEMKKGNFNQVCTVEKNNELGILTYEFNSMSMRLSKVLNDLQLKERELELTNEILEERVNIRTKELADNMEKLKEQQEKLTAEKIRAGKLESLELLSGGVAHDFNNMLTVIAGNLGFLKSEELDDDIKQYVAEIEAAILQAQDLTQQLLNFSKPTALAKSKIIIEEFLHKTVNLILANSNVECNFYVAPDVYKIEADESQLRQVFNNLIINAVQSMPEGGTITVTAKNYVADNADLYSFIPPKYVIIAVEDQGGGIPEDSKEMIFDPYFTTKEFGNGLGLATSYSIINKHGGNIWFESEVGKGTTFYIYLPALRD